jgi:hypothetical protein
VLDGLVSWGNTLSGLRLAGGSKIKVRNGVFLANGLNGIYVTSYNGTAAGNDLSQVDLGTTASQGRNYLQELSGPNRDITGLCVSMAGSMGTLSLNAAGNIFAGPTDCGSSTAMILSSTTCSNYVDLGVVSASGTTVNVDVSGCTK